MVTRHPDYNPSIAIHPGVTLREELEFLQLSQVELSLRTGLSTKTISQIIHGEEPITTETAIKLERVLGTPADFWNAKQTSYEFTLARLEEEKRLEKEVPEAKNYGCYAELVRLSAVRNVSAWNEKAEELLNFFRVDSLSFVPALQGVALRKSAGDFDKHALFAWLQCGEHLVRGITLSEYSEKKLRESIPEIKKLIRGKGEFFAPLQKLCAEAGVAVVYTPYFSKTKVNGAVRWVGNNPLIQLNSRGAYQDIFWFTLFHEIGHILLHGKKDKFVEFGSEQKSDKEKEADQFAQEQLIPHASYKKLLEKKTITPTEAEAFAQSVGVDLGVLVGRFAYDKLVTWGLASGYRKKIELPDPQLNLVS